MVQPSYLRSSKQRNKFGLLAHETSSGNYLIQALCLEVFAKNNRLSSHFSLETWGSDKSLVELLFCQVCDAR